MIVCDPWQNLHPPLAGHALIADATRPYNVTRPQPIPIKMLLSEIGRWSGLETVLVRGVGPKLTKIEGVDGPGRQIRRRKGLPVADRAVTPPDRGVTVYS